jgi:hypothetical protein
MLVRPQESNYLSYYGWLRETNGLWGFTFLTLGIRFPPVDSFFELNGTLDLAAKLFNNMIRLGSQPHF